MGESTDKHTKPLRSKVSWLSCRAAQYGVYFMWGPLGVCYVALAARNSMWLQANLRLVCSSCLCQHDSSVESPCVCVCVSIPVHGGQEIDMGAESQIQGLWIS